MKTNTTEANANSKPMWTPPAGWFKAACIARDVEGTFQSLVADNNRRAALGLPTFEPSYELAYKIAENSYAGMPV